MRYLFTNKKIRVGDICMVFCNKEQFQNFKFQKYFPKISSLFTDLNKFGIKVIKVSNTKLQGYMVHYVMSKEVKKLEPWKFNNKKIYLNITNHNCVGIIKYR